MRSESMKDGGNSLPRVRVILRGVSSRARVSSRVGRKRTVCTTPIGFDSDGVDPEVAWWLEELLAQALLDGIELETALPHRL